MTIDVNGKSIQTVIKDMLEFVNDWKEVKPTDENVNKHGLQIFAEFVSVLNLEAKAEMVNLEKEEGL